MRSQGNHDVKGVHDSSNLVMQGLEYDSNGPSPRPIRHDDQHPPALAPGGRTSSGNDLSYVRIAERGHTGAIALIPFHIPHYTVWARNPPSTRISVPVTKLLAF